MGGMTYVDNDVRVRWNSDCSIEAGEVQILRPVFGRQSRHRSSGGVLSQGFEHKCPAPWQLVEGGFIVQLLSRREHGIDLLVDPVLQRRINSQMRDRKAQRK